MPANWVTLYAPDGVTQEIDKWESRSETPSGPEVLWTPSTTGEYYFAVRNFGGLTGVLCPEHCSGRRCSGRPRRYASFSHRLGIGAIGQRNGG